MPLFSAFHTYFNETKSRLPAATNITQYEEWAHFLEIYEDTKNMKYNWFM